ncbi:MAG TPA: gliding motility-associated C-terminal domain-containing protein [Saprospiraceae bacterium]|nr:gliding motility-associated C-terminal domain-containing protein [Saprospiraceae bacterium]
MRFIALISQSILIVAFLSGNIFAQGHNNTRKIESCQQNYFSVLGSLIQDETGFCITSSPDQKSIYLGGLRGDSALVLKIDPSGELDWTRSFSFVPGVPNHIYGIIVDSDGKVVISGFAGQQLNGGTIFIARYDADLNKILWAKKLTGGSDNFNLGLIEMGAGGDYLLSNNPVSPNVAELIRIERLTGSTVNGFRKQYDLGSSETICDLIIVNGRLFGCGRFSDGGSVNEMRNTLLEFNPNNGNVLWMKLGHKPASVEARLYGWDLVAADNDLFSIYSGDENSGSLNNTKIYVQRTSFDGQLRWIKEFNLPGNNDWVDELIESDNGLVIMARNRVAPSDLILFKIDYNGKFIWAKQYDYTNNDNGIAISGSMSQLISVDNHFFFTGFAEENGNIDLVLIKTDLEGNITDTCDATQSIIIPSRDLVNPLFYSRTPSITNVTPTVQNLAISAGKATSITTHLICATDVIVESMISQTICSGETFEGYTQAGTYMDTLVTSTGCDSVRTLTLTVLPPGTTLIDLIICQGESAEGYSQTGFYVDTLQTSQGCDSIRNLNLTVQPKINTEIDFQICQGDSFEGYSSNGIYEDTYQTIDGCDSIRLLNLTVLASPVSQLDRQICSGDIFEGYSATGIYQDTFQSVEGCDSIRVLHLLVQSTLSTMLDKQICVGDIYEGYATTGIYQDTFLATGGCDSIRILNLMVNTSITDTVSVSICQGENFYGHTVSGQYLDTIFAIQGCDTFRTFNLSIIPSSYRYMETTICNGEEYLEHGASGVYFDTLVTNLGCDSIVELHLTVRDEINSLVIASVCDEIAGPFVTPGTFMDTLIAASGCDSILRIEINDQQVYVPNVFSPNDDGINDVFTVFTKDDKPLHINYFGLFDRFGDMVYETYHWPIQWNGSDLKKESYQPAVFAYVLNYDCGQKQILLNGSVTLIK